MALAPYLTMRGVKKNPNDLPKNALFGDSIRGSGPQIFRVAPADGKYKVFFLNPDQSAREETATASAGRLDIQFPDGEWNIAGLIVKKIRPGAGTGGGPLACPGGSPRYGTFGSSRRSSREATDPRAAHQPPWERSLGPASLSPGGSACRVQSD